MSRTQLKEWKALAEHGRQISRRLPRYFAETDSVQREDWQLDAPGVQVDYSRQLADEETLDLLKALARACAIDAARDAMFEGRHVNTTEDRPAWHTALRSEPTDPGVATLVSTQRARMYEVAEHIRGEHAQGRLKQVIVIGIGGSDLGPRLVTTALGRGSGPVVHFVSNLDPIELDQATGESIPGETAVIAVSKSFSTLETLENLKVALAWLGPGGERRAYAVTSARDKAESFGVPPENILLFPDWVGGRFSVWSACGLPVAIAHGSHSFDSLLGGAQLMDAHVRESAFGKNAPALLALLDVWNSNFLGFPTRAVFPYSQRLRQLPAYLQQLEMESCGKSVDVNGAEVDYATSPVVWGEVGTSAQHSVFQFLHQGTSIAASEFVVIAAHRESTDRRERLLTDFALAQADALALGDLALPEKSRPSRQFARCPGARPSTLLWLRDLSPAAIGAFLALSEHRTTIRASIWDINAFDQWGVEIGKRLLALRNTPGS